jgi:hypothetical protein
MSVLKTSLANPSRIQGIYRYLLQQNKQREKRDLLEQILSPNKLVEGKNPPRPMFRAALNESLKCGLLIVEENDYIAINPKLLKEEYSLKVRTQLLPNILADLFFASDNKDEYHFGLNCAWYLAQEIYDAPGIDKEAEERVAKQEVGELLRMSSDRLFNQLDDWMCYLGLAWGHAIKEGDKSKRILVPDPTLYLKRNLRYLFQQSGEKILLREFIDRLAKKCPLFETGHFRETIEASIGRRQPNYLSTSTAFALFRLQDEEHIQLIRESDADLTILPKANDRVDDDSRISHIIYRG